MIIKMIGYLLLSFFLVIAVADCIAAINSQVVKRGENITFPIDHDTKSGKELDVTVALDKTLIAQLNCSVTCELNFIKPGSRIVYENGTVIIMNSSRIDVGIYEIHYSGSSLKTDETKKYINVTVIDDDNLPSTFSPGPPSNYPSTTPAESSVGSRPDPPRTISLEHLTIIAVAVGVVGVVILAVVFVIIWRCQKKKKNISDAGVGAGDSVI